jgi:hypothetical protein
MKNTLRYVLTPAVSILLALSFGCRYINCPVEEPYVVIQRPPPTSRFQALPPVIVFEWRSELDEDPEFVRYLCSEIIDTNGEYDPSFDVVLDLNENPRRYDHLWSKWIRYDERNESGHMVTIGLDDPLEIGKAHIFAVQARGRCRTVTRTFSEDRNVRLFVVSSKVAPLLYIREPNLGSFKFLGTSMNPVQVRFAPGAPLNFSWEADASDYGGLIVSYRYGWNITDPADPGQWDVCHHPTHTSAPEKSLFSGIHTLWVETIDNASQVTIGRIEIEIVPFTMERDLLWVDDFYSTEFQQIYYLMPTESEHDGFWLDICSRASGFEPGRDVYDCSMHGGDPPDLTEIAGYKNIIWTCSNVEDETAWFDLVEFIPENMVMPSGPRTFNYLPIFLAKGGHLWTLGRTDRYGGLAAIFPVMPPLPAAFISGMNPGLPYDSGWELSMGHDDYCVTMVDKISGQFRPVDDMPGGITRRLKYYDVMTYADRADDDDITSGYPGLPQRLDLWSEVTDCPTCFFRHNGSIGGFSYVEVYDPAYYMDFKNISSLDCFHPIYRMRSCSSRSVLNGQAVALWITKYDNVYPQVSDGWAARSLHFGFPLWFFDREQVDRIVGVVFDEWHLPRRE